MRRKRKEKLFLLSLKLYEKGPWRAASDRQERKWKWEPRSTPTSHKRIYISNFLDCATLFTVAEKEEIINEERKNCLFAFV